MVYCQCFIASIIETNVYFYVVDDCEQPGCSSDGEQGVNVQDRSDSSDRPPSNVTRIPGPRKFLNPP